MSQLAEARSNKVFRVEQRGRALVVTPRGDLAGLGHTDVKAEWDAVAELVAGAEQDVILDFGESNYFGSEMIGLVNRLVDSVRERGGRHAVVNVSDEMQRGLAVLKLDEGWNITSEETANREIARLTPLDRLRPYVKPLIAVALVLVVAGLAVAFLLTERGGDARDYEELARVWDSVQRRRSGGLPNVDRGVPGSRHLPRVTEIVERLEESPGEVDSARRHLLNAARDHLVPILEDRGNPIRERAFVQEMRRARTLLGEEGESLPEVHDIAFYDPDGPGPSDDEDEESSDTPESANPANDDE